MEAASIMAAKVRITLTVDPDVWQRVQKLAEAMRLGDGRGAGASALLTRLADEATRAADTLDKAALGRVRPLVSFTDSRG